MLTRRPPFVQEGNDRIMMQDGFSAPVDSVPRPRFSSACAMVGRHVMDFSDNGDGTLTAVRCIDRQADDLDIQFEAGACPVVAIAPHAFEGCAALRRVILPESLRQIGEMAFSGCAHLRTLVIPGGVRRVGTLAFAKCSQMERVRIEPGVAQLGPSCFSKCAALKRVEIPASVAQIGGGAFFGNVGSFLEGYEFDAVVLDDASLDHPQELSVRARLERAAYLADDRNLTAKFVAGQKILG